MNNSLLLAALVWLTFVNASRAQPTEMMVDQQPEYAEGGMDGFYRLITEKIRCSVSSRRTCHQGISYVSFVINQDGSTDEAHVL